MSRLSASGDQNTGASALASVFPKYLGLIFFKIDWFDLLAAKGLSRIFSAPPFKGINSSALCHLYGPALATMSDHWKALTIQTFVGKVMSFLFNTLSRLVIAFLPRSRDLKKEDLLIML